MTMTQVVTIMAVVLTAFIGSAAGNPVEDNLAQYKGLVADVNLVDDTYCVYASTSNVNYYLVNLVQFMAHSNKNVEIHVTSTITGETSFIQLSTQYSNALVANEGNNETYNRLINDIPVQLETVPMGKFDKDHMSADQKTMQEFNAAAEQASAEYNRIRYGA